MHLFQADIYRDWGASQNRGVGSVHIIIWCRSKLPAPSLFPTYTEIPYNCEFPSQLARVGGIETDQRRFLFLAEGQQDIFLRWNTWVSEITLQIKGRGSCYVQQSAKVILDCITMTRARVSSHFKLRHYDSYCPTLLDHCLMLEI